MQCAKKGMVLHMKIVVVKSPRFLRPFLRLIFKIKKEV